MASAELGIDWTLTPRARQRGDVADGVILGPFAHGDQPVLAVPVADGEVAGGRNPARLALYPGQLAGGGTLDPADGLQPADPREPDVGELLEVVVGELGGGDHDALGGLEHVEVVGEAVAEQAGEVAGVPLEARLKALLLPFADLQLEPAKQDQRTAHRQGDGEPARRPVFTGRAEEGEGQRGGNEDPDCVAGPPAAPAEGGRICGDRARQHQRADAQRGADQAAERRRREQEANRRARRVEGVREAHPAPGQMGTHNGLQRRTGADAERHDPAPACQPRAQHGLAVDDQAADEDARPDAIAMDQHGGEGDAGGGIERRDIARRNGQLQRQQPGEGVGDGESDEGPEGLA